jgi:hypothetical protein
MPDKGKSSINDSLFQRRFILLLSSVVILFVLHPFVPGEVIGIRVIDIFFIIILLSGLHAVSDRKSLLYIAFLSAITAFSSGVLILFIKNPAILLTMYTSFIIFFLIVTLAILSHLLRAERVTGEIIFGSICVYLIIGLIWAMIYSVIEIIKPGSFYSSIEVFGTSGSELLSRASVKVLIYYSFTTMTTLGYGDIVPLTPPARMFSTLEAVVGQIYLAVLIARLVGLHIVQSKRE